MRKPTQVRGKPSTRSEKLYVGVKTGLPRRGIMESDGSPTTIIDFYDDGAKITIAPPACS